jgi:gliding motility-associated protein GldC
MQEKEIKIKVVLDDRNTPESIFWQADDQPGTERIACKAFLLSLFDKEHLDTFKLDLWTKDLQVNEMDKFMFQTLRGLVDTYYKATNNGELSNELQRFVHYFGEKTGIIEPESED